MAIAYEGNTDLAFDTDVLRTAAAEYKAVADELREMSGKLDSLLAELTESGWTTPAASVFYEMTNTNWSQNIEKYASLLDMLNDILINASVEYESLMTDYVRTTELKNI